MFLYKNMNLLNSCGLSAVLYLVIKCHLVENICSEAIEIVKISKNFLLILK
jgi:hypothetical protein